MSGVIRPCELYVCQCPCCHARTGAQVGAVSPEARDKLALKNETDLKNKHLPCAAGATDRRHVCSRGRGALTPPCHHRTYIINHFERICTRDSIITACITRYPPSVSASWLPISVPARTRHPTRLIPRPGPGRRPRHHQPAMSCPYLVSCPALAASTSLSLNIHKLNFCLLYFFDIECKRSLI